MKIEIIRKIDDVKPDFWQSSQGDDYPFLNHGFLRALEASGCVAPDTGWQPHHLAAMSDERVVAIMPQYFKTHSWGEYVFDHEWANAYHRYGIRYYPKLINAIPFTPATGPRWIVNNPQPDFSPQKLIQENIHLIENGTASSWHCLFPNEECEGLLKESHLLKRVGYQFHWFNKGYQSFDDFLALFASRKRKNVRKERAALDSFGLSFQRKLAREIDQEEWALFYQFYAGTYYKRGHSPHLNLEFFESLARELGDAVVVDWVYDREGIAIAAALFFKDKTTLYGRYWGANRDVPGLHFEVCFYRGIEYAIELGLQRFDPGTQGEHKVSRGFEPIETCSYHYIGHPGFRDAIENFLTEEAGYVAQYREMVAEKLPFKKHD